MTHSKKLIYQAFKVSDLLSMLSGIILMVYFQTGNWSQTSLVEFLAYRISLINLGALLILCLINIYIFLQFHLYHPKFMPHHFINDGLAIAKATFINTMLLVSVGAVAGFSIFDPFWMFVAFWPSVIILTIFMRHFIWHLLKRIHLGDKNSRNVLIIGTNKDACHYGEMTQEIQDMGYNFLGYIDDDCLNESIKDQVIGGFKDFKHIMKDRVVDEIIICTTFGKLFEQIEPIIMQAHAQGIIVRFPLINVLKPLLKEADVLRVSCERAIISATGKTAPELLIHSGFQMGWHYLAKRFFDVCVAGFLLIILSPILLTVAAIIRLTSKGPAMFLQDRYGYNGRVFKVFKFRSMIQNADELQAKLRATSNEMDGAAFKMKDDPRITAIGKFIRKTSIDELPQLINVVKGDMSLVGPRPLPLADYEQMTEIKHLRRLSVLPGITGAWQVEGRSNLSFEEWMKLDLDYIDNWSHSSDLKILLKTIPAVLKGQGAH
jgi:exopolysaccharide biosynthesis polyprenyl glycosylphosphotransferase